MTNDEHTRKRVPNGEWTANENYRKLEQYIEYRHSEAAPSVYAKVQ